MLTLNTFRSSDRATGKTNMMLSFLREDSKLFISCLAKERLRFIKSSERLKSVINKSNFAFFHSLHSEYWRGRYQEKIDIIFSDHYISSMNKNDLDDIKYSLDMMRASRNDISIYIESDNPQGAEKFISAINPDIYIIFDDYLCWDENHHAIGENICRIKKEQEKIRESGFKHFSIFSKKQLINHQ